MTSPKNGKCQPEDAGVDLNRNYGMDWGVFEASGDKDQSSDPCGESYKGKSAFSEKETQALRDFIDQNQAFLKFVINIHSNGNSYIFPYNGRSENDIETRNPGTLEIFTEIARDATWPAEHVHNGNSKTIIGDQMGGDMDDWVLATYNIPSVTGEIGN